MDMCKVALPKVFANTSFSVWLSGEWPTLSELMRDCERMSGKTGLWHDYAQRRHEWIAGVKKVIRAARPPLLCGDVFVAFVHRRAGYRTRSRTDYSGIAESFILPALAWSGTFRESAVLGVTHLFDSAEPGAAGIEVMVAEHWPPELGRRADELGQLGLPGFTGG